jgi:hypothetical protein
MANKLTEHLNEVRTLPVITLEAIVDHLQDEALIILCLVSILPFMQPIPIPGLSSVLGLVCLFQGLGLILGKKPLLTKKMRQAKISHERFEQIFKAAAKFDKLADKISLFQHSWINTRASHVICGIAIVLSSAFLSLPLPIPFSNFVPALSIFFICVGLLEEDIFLTIIGLIVTISVMAMAVFSYNLIHQQLSNLF